MEEARPRAVQIWLIVETCLAVPAIAGGLLMAIFTPMMFDAPGSTNNPALIVLAVSVAAFPVVTFFALVFAWIAFARRRSRGAVWFSLLPFVPLVTGIIGLAAG